MFFLLNVFSPKFERQSIDKNRPSRGLPLRLRWPTEALAWWGAGKRIWHGHPARLIGNHLKSWWSPAMSCMLPVPPIELASYRFRWAAHRSLAFSTDFHGRKPCQFQLGVHGIRSKHANAAMAAGAGHAELKNCFERIAAIGASSKRSMRSFPVASFGSSCFGSSLLERTPTLG